MWIQILELDFDFYIRFSIKNRSRSKGVKRHSNVTEYRISLLFVCIDLLSNFGNCCCFPPPLLPPLSPVPVPLPAAMIANSWNAWCYTIARYWCLYAIFW